jgi:transposase InsO family protein
MCQLLGVPRLNYYYEISQVDPVEESKEDNAVAETTCKTFKTEFCNKRFETIAQLETELFDYVNWYNTKRIHGSLGYLSPVEYRRALSI